MGGDSLSVPILYEANATDFNNLGLGPLADTTVATVTEERNGQFILEMQYPVEGIRSSLITKNRILKVDAGHKLKDQRFVIKRINRIMGNDGLSYSIYAEHISYITADYALKPNLTISGSGNVAMTQWLNGIIDSNRIHVDSDIATENTTSWTIDKVQNARQALGGVQGSILDIWGGEYRFDNLNISLLRHRGTVSNTLLSYGRNITDFDQEENITNTYTSIYPFASYSVQNGDTSEQKILTIPDLVVDSEYVKNFPNRKIQVVDFSDKFNTDEKPTVERLTELAKSYIKSNNVGVPTVSTKISFVDLSKTENYKEFTPLEELDLCDEVPFVFDKFGIKTTAKVSRIVWNVLLDSYDSLELGELKTNLSDVINNTNNAANDAKDAANDAKNNADNAALSANGKNRNWYGADDPTFGHLSELREGDSWYMPNGEDTELYHWINGQWVFILSTKDAHDAAGAADKASKEAGEAKVQANDAVGKANQAVTDAGFANDTADQAKLDAAAAGQQAINALTNARTALTNAKTALDNVAKLDQTVKTEVTNINGQLSQKVNQTTFDTLKGTVTSQGTLINQNKAAIQLKADLSLVNTIKQTVTNNTAAIDLNSKEIKLKANQSTVDSLNGTVKNLDAEQKIQAGQIAQTVSKTELTSKLNGYATQTWTQGQIKTTADNINLSVSKVQTDLSGTKTQFAALEVKVNGIQTTVSGKADQAQVTQLADQITSVVGSVEQIGNEGRNYFHNSNLARDLNSWGIDKAGSTNPSIVRSEYYKLGYKIGLHMFGISNVPYNGFWQQTNMYGSAGDNVVLSFIAAQDGGHDSMLHIGLTFYKDGQNVGSTSFDMQTKNFDNSSGSRESHTFKAPVEFNKVVVRLAPTANVPINVWLTNFKLESNKLTPYTEAPEDRATQSQITQLADDINLRVQKGDVVNQINISPEGILIDGKKIHITGQTRIDNAVIKDAMIADVKADKITAGTLNAANVNVINLNANNITTGTIKGANLSMNLNTGEVVFQHGRIHSASNNVDVNIDQGYLSVADSVNRVLLKGGQMQFVAPNLFDNQTNPYLSISNSGGGQGLFGGQIVGRDFLSLANSANNTGFFDNSLGIETFAGISFGKANGTWRPTKIGGADRGIMLVGGASMPSNMFGDSPSIIIGANKNLQTTGNRIVINGEYIHAKSVYEKTSSASANVVVNSDGSIVRSTSASKYKMDIIRTNTPDYGEKLLELPTATWMDIAETKRYRDDPVNQVKPTRNFGMIAEDLADAGLEMLVVRGADGELEGINYDRIGPALIPVIAKLKNEVETLKQQLEEKTA